MRMKLLFDYFPILCFFIAYKFYGIYTATAITMAASVLQVGGYWFKHRRFDNMHLITMCLILVLGSATLFFHEDIFIKWKPSVIYWLFAIALFGSPYYGTKKPLISRLFASQIELPLNIWKQINLSWGVFFTLMGIVNLYVVYHYSTGAWVNFKLFGTLGLTTVFCIVQAFYINRHSPK